MKANYPVSIEDIEPLTRGLFIAATSLVDYPNQKRKEVRTPLKLPCTIVPIDRNGNPIGKPFAAITTDISNNGIGLLFKEPMEPQLILVSISKSPDETVQLIADVIRCGDVNGYFRIGAKLVQRVNAAD
jgi:hypothetical protein